MPNLSKRRFLQYTAAAGVVLALSACGGGDSNDADIVERLAADPQFSLLVEAVQAAGLVETLQSAGPFTVFAPTNDAFVALLGEVGLSKEAVFGNTALLTTILTYHVLAGEVPSRDVPRGTNIETVQGENIVVNRGDSTLVITDARGRTSNITFTNIDTSNGVIHRVDRVILPLSLPQLNIVQAARVTPSLSILVEAVVAAGLGATLSSPGPFTVFAPTNDAFNKVPAPLLGLIGGSNDLLTQVLTYHVLAIRVTAADVAALTKPAAITTVQGSTFEVGADLGLTDGRGRRASLLITDIAASNGVIHAIDRVILPPA